MKKFLVLLMIGALLTVSVPAQMLQSISNASKAGGTWSLVQHPTVGTATCTNATTCSITLTQSLATGNAAIIVMGPGNNVTISSINVGGSLTLCPSSNCHQFQSGSGDMDAAYILSTSATAGPVIVTFSGSDGSSVGTLREYHCVGGTISADTSNSSQATGLSSPFTGQALSPTGLSDVIVSWAVDDANVTAVASPYSTNADFVQGVGFADRLNTTSGTAPSWTGASTTQAVVGGVALKCQ